MTPKGVEEAVTAAVLGADFLSLPLAPVAPLVAGWAAYMYVENYHKSRVSKVVFGINKHILLTSVCLCARCSTLRGACTLKYNSYYLRTYILKLIKKGEERK